MKKEGKQTLMRIFISECDRWQGKPLYKALMDFLEKRGFDCLAVVRRVAIYSSYGSIHTEKILHFSSDQPIVVEVLEAKNKIESILPELDGMLKTGMVTLEDVHVIKYGSFAPK
jgi:PII-like signaling protein